MLVETVSHRVGAYPILQLFHSTTPYSLMKSLPLGQGAGPGRGPFQGSGQTRKPAVEFGAWTAIKEPKTGTHLEPGEDWNTLFQETFQEHYDRLLRERGFLMDQERALLKLRFRATSEIATEPTWQDERDMHRQAVRATLEQLKADGKLTRKRAKDIQKHLNGQWERQDSNILSALSATDLVDDAGLNPDTGSLWSRETRSIYGKYASRWGEHSRDYREYRNQCLAQVLAIGQLYTIVNVKAGISAMNRWDWHALVQSVVDQRDGENLLEDQIPLPSEGDLTHCVAGLKKIQARKQALEGLIDETVALWKQDSQEHELDLENHWTRYGQVLDQLLEQLNVISTELASDDEPPSQGMEVLLWDTLDLWSQSDVVDVELDENAPLTTVVQQLIDTCQTLRENDSELDQARTQLSVDMKYWEGSDAIEIAFSAQDQYEQLAAGVLEVLETDEELSPRYEAEVLGNIAARYTWHGLCSLNIGSATLPGREPDWYKELTVAAREVRKTGDYNTYYAALDQIRAAHHLKPNYLRGFIDDVANDSLLAGKISQDLLYDAIKEAVWEATPPQFVEDRNKIRQGPGSWVFDHNSVLEQWRQAMPSVADDLHEIRSLVRENQVYDVLASVVERIPLACRPILLENPNLEPEQWQAFLHLRPDAGFDDWLAVLKTTFLETHGVYPRFVLDNLVYRVADLLFLYGTPSNGWFQPAEQSSRPYLRTTTRLSNALMYAVTESLGPNQPETVVASQQNYVATKFDRTGKGYFQRIQNLFNSTAPEHQKWQALKRSSLLAYMIQNLGAVMWTLNPPTGQTSIWQRVNEGKYKDWKPPAMPNPAEGEGMSPEYTALTRLQAAAIQAHASGNYDDFDTLWQEMAQSDSPLALTLELVELMYAGVPKQMLSEADQKAILQNSTHLEDIPDGRILFSGFEQGAMPLIYWFNPETRAEILRDSLGDSLVQQELLDWATQPEQQSMVAEVLNPTETKTDDGLQEQSNDLVDEMLIDLEEIYDESGIDDALIAMEQQLANAEPQSNALKTEILQQLTPVMDQYVDEVNQSYATSMSELYLTLLAQRQDALTELEQLRNQFRPQGSGQPSLYHQQLQNAYDEILQEQGQSLNIVMDDSVRGRSTLWHMGPNAWERRLWQLALGRFETNREEKTPYAVRQALKGAVDRHFRLTDPREHQSREPHERPWINYSNIQVWKPYKILDSKVPWSTYIHEQIEDKSFQPQVGMVMPHTWVHQSYPDKPYTTPIEPSNDHPTMVLMSGPEQALHATVKDMVDDRVNRSGSDEEAIERAHEYYRRFAYQVTEHVKQIADFQFEA